MADGKRRILVVDDEPSIAKIVKKQLEVAGYEVLVAVDGQDGLDKARQERPDMMVLDVMLPKMNGFEVCATLKQDPQYRQIPILMLTAKAQRQDYQQGLQQGAEAYLTKPFKLEELLSKVQALLQQAAAASPAPSAGPATPTPPAPSTPQPPGPAGSN